jgi:hypothetical protein
MITLVKKHINELSNDYIKLFTSVFGSWETEGNCPADVYLTYDNSLLIGFVSGFPVSPNTWYLQRGGFIKNEQSKVMNLCRYKEALNIINKEYPFINTVVLNTDLPALKICLASNFVIMGVRLDTVNKLWVEMIRKGDLHG